MHDRFCKWPLRITSAMLGATFMAACCVVPAAAQQAARVTQSTAPVPLLPAPPKDPELGPDGSATFRLLMPGAQTVALALEGRKDPMPMARGADGVWSLTVPAMTPEFYSYSFNVDAKPGIPGSGTDVADPHNTSVKTSFTRIQNVFLVPGQPPRPWETANVPHGVVHHHIYHSDVVGIDSHYFVYTPPGFDPTSHQTYPVLYLLHGYNDEPSAWTAMGKANVILDNLIAAGKAKPMIVVMPWGYGDMRIVAGGWASWRDPAVVASNFEKFPEALFQEVMPRVKREYPLSSRREDHAIAGLSMGGAETLLVALKHIDDFAWVGAFSPGGLGGDHFEPLFPQVTPQSGPAMQSRLKLFWIACGTDDGLLEPDRHLIAWLKTNGMQPTAIETPGAHVWMVWRENLSAFAPLLFR